MLPIIQHIKCAGRDLESLETVEKLKEHLGNDMVEASIDGVLPMLSVHSVISPCYYFYAMSLFHFFSFALFENLSL